MTYSFHSVPDVTIANIVKNICHRKWKPVVILMFGNRDLKRGTLVMVPWKQRRYIAVQRES